MSADHNATIATETPPGARGCSLQRVVRRQFGDCTMILADCLDVLPEIVCDAIVCDPPYGVTDHEWDCLVKQEWLDACLKATDGPVAMANATRPDVLRHMLSLQPSADRVIAWRQPRVTAKGGLFWSWQPILVWRAKKFEGWDTVEYPTDGGNYLHPTQKPVELMAWLMRVMKVGEIICDPWMGSGTTAIACIRTGRKFVGIEKDAKHFETACERVANELAQGVLLPPNNQAERQP